MKAKCNNCINDCRRKQMKGKGKRTGMFYRGKFVMYADCSFRDMQACNLHKLPRQGFKVEEVLHYAKR